MKKLVLVVLALTILVVVGCGGKTKSPAPITAANFNGTWIGKMSSIDNHSFSVGIKLVQGKVVGINPDLNAEFAPVSGNGIVSSAFCPAVTTITAPSGQVTGDNFGATFQVNDGGTLLLSAGLAKDGVHTFDGTFKFISGTCVDEFGSLTLTKQ